MNNPIKNVYKDNKKRFGKKVKVTRADKIIETTAIIKEYNNIPISSTDDKKIYFDVEDAIQQGDLIQFENNTYLIILQEETINNIYIKYIMRRCDNKIKIYIDNKLEEVHCCISTFVQDAEENAKIKLPSGNIKIICQMNDITSKITYDKRFLKMQNAWKVVGFTSENKGIKYLYAEKVAIDNVNDNVESEIADYWKYNVKHNYSINIVEDNISIEEGKTKQLIVNITDTIDGKIENVINPTLIYTSNDKNIVTVDSKGLITGVAEGNTTIKVQFKNVEKIINVKVVKPLPIVATYEIKTITLDGVEFTGDTITIDNNTSKVLKVTEIEKKTTQGDNTTTEIIENPIVHYSCNNSNISVDNNIGKITAINAGSTILTISYENITKQININVIEAVKLEITGKSRILLGRTSTWNSNIPVVWSVEDIGNNGKVVKQWATITDFTDTTCTIKITDEYIFDDALITKFKITAAAKNNNNIKVDKEVDIITY
ncbi:bacterial Ig-like domain protein [Clostridium acetireducens DSM 10703]|uniref:Bacterial Ig-like domain protein n=1 Tax=Clostridium acetireducens DSM 10703 TaxID=1121290 RepID=A0A1E8EXK0_9CLOT|nr:Ig-like domain-containing protein [Clostridium acetireducens]OFI05258.1 bacterial Ig-like domain protein [Clostridium acetireducens DSM 10703]